MKLEFKDIKQNDWSKHVTLTAEQRNQLIREKLERARLYHLASRPRENDRKTIVR